MKKRGDELIYVIKNKKGLSTIIVTLLIISLAVVGIGIIWQIVSGILKSSQEDSEFGQSRLNMLITSVFIDTSYTSIKVNRFTGPGTVEGIKFIFSDGQRTESIDNLTNIEELEEKTFRLVLTTLEYSELKTVSIAPFIVLPSGARRLGNILHTYTIKGGNYNGSGDWGTGGGQVCNEILPCPGDIEGSSECDTITGNILTHWTVYTCVSGECVSEEVSRLAQICSTGCEIQNATCTGGGNSSNPDCYLPTDCGVSGQIGLTFCENVTGDVYQNYVNYSCNLGSCSNEVIQQRIQSCDGFGCVMGEVEAECNPGLECVTNSDCDPDDFIANSEQCVGNEVWIDWKHNFCLDNLCSNDVSQVPKDGGDCSAKEGNWSCMQGECIEYVECTQDSHCNVNGTCGKMCVNEKCMMDYALNSGVVSSIWPFDMAEYFDSISLPKSDVSYVNYFTKFTSGNEGRCLQIKEYVYPTPPGVNSYIRFDIKSTGVLPGDNYEIWRTKANCEC